MKLPSTRPALVSEVCLSSQGSRARAFHVLDPRGVIDTISVFVESQEEDSLVPEVQYCVSQCMLRRKGLSYSKYAIACVVS